MTPLTVEGSIRDNLASTGDALVAGFPAGLVSGMPKIRAMQLIDDLEPIALASMLGSWLDIGGW